MTEKLVELKNLSKSFPVRSGWRASQARIHAVDSINLDLRPGEILSLVGESGCGKSTLGRLTMGLIKPTGGSVLYRGSDIAALTPKEMRALRSKMQIVFQDPYSSLDPRMRIFDILAEPLIAQRRSKNRQELSELVAALLEKVGLHPDSLFRFPHEFSGGQRQRIGVARAIALQPELVVCDEPLSALDVSIRAQVINLLAELRQELNLTYLFISHDLSVVRYLSDRIAVMYLGHIVEIGTGREVLDTPLHPYTHSLIASSPLPNPHARGRERMILSGDLPSPINPPSGCRFHTRCPEARPVCSQEVPTPPDGLAHGAACLFHAR